VARAGERAGIVKLLIVEDNQRMRRLLRQLVKGLVDEIIECSDGMEAVTAYAHHLPDRVLMDIARPGLDGITATRQIKAAHPEANVVIITDYDDAHLRQAAAAAGAREYVLKEDLLALRAVLSRHPGGSSKRKV
jgi:CheY-like chemotaxis protein